MSETNQLLERIAAIRQRLGQAQGMLSDAHFEVADLAKATAEVGPVARERAQNLLIRAFDRLDVEREPVAEPATKNLTGRVKDGLARCQSLVHDLKQLGLSAALENASISSPLAISFDRCTALANAAVRFAQALPESATEQTRLCEGLDGMLDALADRIGGLRAAVRRDERANERIASLAHLLTGLISGSSIALESFTALAEAIACDARQGEPLHALSAGLISPATSEMEANEWRARHIAAHAINTAQVLARVQSETNEAAALDAIVAALLHDVGMMAVPVPILAQPGALTPAQQRVVEQHCEHGADIVKNQIYGAESCLEVIRHHHERCDGTGYPTGRKHELSTTALLAVCDCYAAMLTARPHRGELDVRSALTETLLLARQGWLSTSAARQLGRLTFLPAGTVVELDDSSTAVVDLIVPRSDAFDVSPVVRILLDDQGRRADAQRRVDLHCDRRRSITRVLKSDERRRRLADKFPEYA